MKSSRCLISGCSGMDGSYLSDLLIEEGHEVWGIMRRVSTPNTKNIEHLIGNPKFHLVDGDLTDLPSLIEAFKESEPDMAFNLAAQSFVATSWRQPILTCNVTGMGAINFFEAARQVKPDTKVYQASTSEMFSGKVYPQNENTPFEPRSPYGAAKLFAHKIADVYRESYGIFIACGILFNHEGGRRGIEFVTQKIVDAAVRQTYKEEGNTLELGNIEACRDWSHAKDMVRGMYLMLQREEPKDYILSSGNTWSVKDFIDATYEYLSEELTWYTSAETGLPMAYSSNCIVKSVPEFYRPNEVDVLCGDSTIAREELGWKPEYDFNSLVKEMVDSRIAYYRNL